MDSSRAEKRYPMPFVRVELILFAIEADRLQVLLARRAEIPEKGKWALPGGVLRIDLDQSLEACAERVAEERLHLRLPSVQQVLAVGGPRRDPRSAWALSVAYRALVRRENAIAVAGKRVAEVAWHPCESAMELQLAFDHGEQLRRAHAALVEEVADYHLPFELINDEFTLSELQQACERVTAHAIDKSSFRKHIHEAQLVVPVEGKFRTGPFRPAAIFTRR